MEENIPLVPYIDLGNFPNDLHLQFSQTQDEQMDAEFDADNPALRRADAEPHLAAGVLP